MPLRMIRNDITKMRVDAIVNPTDPSLSGSGGTDRCVHEAAGPDLAAACRALGACLPGEAKWTPAFDLPAQYIIHTVGPVWEDGQHGEAMVLRRCYRSVLELAASRQWESLAVPLLATGNFGFPKDLALSIAVEEISAFLMRNDLIVWIVVFDRTAYQISGKLFDDITEYIDDRYAEEHTTSGYERPSRRPYRPLPVGKPPMKADEEDALCCSAAYEPASGFPEAAAARKASDRSREKDSSGLRNEKTPSRRNLAAAQKSFRGDSRAEESVSGKSRSLEEAMDMMDESFSEMLLRKIDEKGMTDAECYRRANIDRRLFSKIRSNPGYRPSKATALAFAVALELPMDEVNELLLKAGFALSHSSRFDIIVEYFLENGNYNLFEINEALFQFDQTLLGG